MTGPAGVGATGDELRTLADEWIEHDDTCWTRHGLTECDCGYEAARGGHPGAEERPVTAPDVAARVAAIECTCGPGVWGTCDYCGAEAWVKHRCPFPCDDATCEDGSICVGCLTGRPCPMHNDDWDDDGGAE